MRAAAADDASFVGVFYLSVDGCEHFFLGLVAAGGVGKCKVDGSLSGTLLSKDVSKQEKRSWDEELVQSR